MSLAYLALKSREQCNLIATNAPIACTELLASLHYGNLLQCLASTFLNLCTAWQLHAFIHSICIMHWETAVPKCSQSALQLLPAQPCSFSAQCDFAAGKLSGAGISNAVHAETCFSKCNAPLNAVELHTDSACCSHAYSLQHIRKAFSAQA